MTKVPFLIWLIVIAGTVVHGQEENGGDSGIGGLFNRLKKAVEVEPSTEPDKKSWFDKAKELGVSTLDKGKEGITELVTAGTESNARMQEMLAWLDTKIAGREPAFTDSEIQEIALEMIPLVEELNGRTFAAPPQVAITGNFEMIQILGNDLVPQLEAQIPDAPKPMVYLKSFVTAGLFSPSLMGKYGVIDNTVYVLPENVKSIMEAGEIDPSLDRDLMKIIVAHELTHALQDQEINLDESMLKVQSADESLAFQATVEGHAVYIQNAVAKKLGLDEAARAGRDMLTAPENKDEAWLINRVAMADAVKWESIYLGGETFIAHHASAGGMEKVWSILKAPPTRTSMIVKPSSYRKDPAPEIDYQSHYREIGKPLGLEEWKVAADSMGDFAIQSHLGAVTREKRDEIMAGLEKSVVINLTGPGLSSETCMAAVFAFADDSGAARMLEAMEELNRHDLASAEASAMVEVLSRKKIDYSAGDNAAGSALRYKTKALFLGEETVSVIQVKRGNLVSQIFYTDLDLRKPQVDQFLHAVMTKLK